jgi:prepilin signal peptidase PulO-like enzyme (type II secretory pathway)
MNPIKHLILGIVLATILFIIFPEISLVPAVIIVASTVLIDIDHYLYYVYKKDDKSLIRAYKWYTRSIKKTRKLPRKQKKEISFGFHFLHGIETILLLYVLYFYFSPIFLYILIGVFFHWGLDLIDEIIGFGKLEKISIIYGLIRHKKLKFIGDLDLLEPEITRELKIPFSKK